MMFRTAAPRASRMDFTAPGRFSKWAWRTLLPGANMLMPKAISSKRKKARVPSLRERGSPFHRVQRKPPINSTQVSRAVG